MPNIGLVTGCSTSTIDPDFMRSHAQQSVARAQNGKSSTDVASCTESEQAVQKRVIEICQEGIQALGKVLDNDNKQKSAEVLDNVLNSTKSQEAVRVLRNILHSPKSREFVKALRNLLNDTNSQKAVEFLNNSLNSSNNEEGAETLREFFYNRNSQEGIQVLRTILHIANNENVCDQLDDFSIYVASNLKAMSSDVRAYLMQSILNDFEDFCSIASSTQLPTETSRQAIHNLAIGLKVCVPGISQNIESAAREIKIFTCGVAQNFINQLTTAIDQYNLRHVPKKNEALDKKKHIDKNVYEIHYLALFFNGVAEHFNLPKRKDAFLEDYYRRRSSDFVEFHPVELKNFAKNLLSDVTVNSVIQCMASDCLERVRAFCKNNCPDIIYNTIDLKQLAEVNKDFEENLKPRLEPFFGPLDASIFFLPCASENERYRLASDDKMIALYITKNLKKSGIIKSQAEYVLGEKGEGLKIKMRDERYYVSETFISSGETTHLRTSIDQFIWQNPERCKNFLEKIEEEYLKNNKTGYMHSVRANIWCDRPESLAREMKYVNKAFGLAEVDKLYEQAFSLLREDDKKNDNFLERLLFEVSGSRELLPHFFKKLNPERFKIESEDFNRILELAILYRQYDVARDLIEKITPEKLSESSYTGTPAMQALYYRAIEFAKTLIEKSSTEQLCIRHRLNETILHVAIKYSPELVGLIVEKLPVEQLNVQEDEGWGDTPLMWALQNNRVEAALLLIEKLDAKQLCVQKRDRWMPKHLTVMTETALMHAISNKQTAATLMLINKLDADQLNIQQYDRITALILALETDQPDVAELLISKLQDAHLEVRSCSKSALIIALKKGYKNIAETIIHRVGQRHIGLPDRDGNTPLMLALLQKYEDLAWMIKKKMNCQQIRLPNDNKQIARNIAQLNGFTKMAEELKQEAGFFNSLYDDIFYG